MIFLIFNNANILFPKKKLILRSFIIVETLLKTKQVEFIDKKLFVIAIFLKNIEAFIIYITCLILTLISIHLVKKA